MNENLKIGAIVLSKSGRDKGRYFIVYKIESFDFVLLVDGHIRKLSKPKLKKIKHISFTENVAENIAIKFENSKQVFDSEIFSALKEYNAE